MILCTCNHLLQIFVHEHLSSVTFQNQVSQQVLYSHKLELEIHSFHGLFVSIKGHMTRNGVVGI